MEEKKLTLAKKDGEEDAEEVTVRNLYVIKLMQSLKSRGYVKETFSWQWYYYYLTDEGIAHLRTYLNIPEEVVPNTLKRQENERTARPQERDFRRGGDRGDRGFGRRRYGDKSGFGRGSRAGVEGGNRRQYRRSEE